MFRDVVAKQGLGVGGALRCCQLPSCSAPSHFGRPAWCCRPLQEADRPQQCNVCKNVPFRFRLCITSVGGSGSQGGIQGSSAFQTCIFLCVVDGTEISPVDKRTCRRCSLTNNLAASNLSRPASSRHTRHSGETAQLGPGSRGRLAAAAGSPDSGETRPRRHLAS